MWGKVLALCLFASICKANTEPEYFTAAVFENLPAHDETMSPEEVTQANLKWMERAAEEAAKRGADIILFSEYGAYRPSAREKYLKYGEVVPDPQKTKVNPCIDAEKGKEGKVLAFYSCLAKKHNMYVVGHLFDIRPCQEASTCDAQNIEDCDSVPKCPKDGYIMYNAEVALDREGNLVARYHKNHLYYPEQLNTPLKPEIVTFESDFGVVFGLMTCFDSVFGDAVDLVKNHRVDTMLYPTHWYDDILPIHASEWQQAWAIANRVNLLVANKHIPGNATLGSGIYSKDLGALVYTYNPDGKYKLLISQVPRHGTELKTKTQLKTEFLILEEDNVVLVEEETGDIFPEQCLTELVGAPKDMAHDYRCYKRQLAKHSLKKLEQAKGKVESCNNKFCCSLKYEAESMEEDYYLTAFSGVNDVRNYYKWIEETCLLVRCDPIGDQSCVTLPTKSKTVFKYAELKAKFKSQTIYPAVSKTNRRLAPKSEWTFSKKGDSVILKFSANTQDPLLKIGLMGRNYAKDPPFFPFHRY